MTRKKRTRLIAVVLLVCLLGGTAVTAPLTSAFQRLFGVNPADLFSPTPSAIYTPLPSGQTPAPVIVDPNNPHDIYGVLTYVPQFDGKQPYAVINNNTPLFDPANFASFSFEDYRELDDLGRCYEAFGNLCTDTMPTEERGDISAVHPSGWHSVKYPFIDKEYLYNRCHLIGYQLSAENDNEKNLITGTRYMNVDGMLPFENMVADYIRATGNHVLYRVSPIFKGDNLVASGVLMEAWSQEDHGEGICFCVYCYNVQPGVTINYATGDSSAD